MAIAAARGRRGRVRAVGIAALALVIGAAGPPGARGQSPAPAAPPPGETLTLPTKAEVPPRGWRLSAREAIQLAERHPRFADARRRHAPTRARALQRRDRRWQVSLHSRAGRGAEVAQALVDDRAGRVMEAWTGVQVGWTMARGYPGAFGRRVNAPWVWIPLLALFLLPFARPPWRMLHLDVVALAAFSVGYALFGAARIAESNVVATLLVTYLLARMLLVARRRGRAGGLAPKPPLRLLVGGGFLAVALVFLVGFRIGLNITASNVIDVGYAGVIGADRIGDGAGLYGRFPPDNPHGDTYGPVNYLVYVPFEQALPWSGSWDALPAAHAAALAFDLSCLLLVWLLGRRLRGPRLGLLLAYCWATFPFTLLVSNSNANDSLVAALVLLAVLVAGRPVLRGAAVAAAGLSKFAPLALAPLLATFPTTTGVAARFGAPAGGAPVTTAPTGPAGATASAVRHWPRALAGPHLPRILWTALGFAATVVPPLALVLVLDGGLTAFVERTLAFQADRDSPFSVWGYWELSGPQRVVQGFGVLLALGLAVVPRRRDVVSLAALAAAVLLALQLGVSHWFYLYVVWFAPLVLVAVLGEHEDPAPDAVA